MEPVVVSDLPHILPQMNASFSRESAMNDAIHRTLHQGTYLLLEDCTWINWHSIADISVFDQANFLFEIFEDVFEKYEVEYVMRHILMYPFRIHTIWFCLDYWERTRNLTKWR